MRVSVSNYLTNQQIEEIVDKVIKKVWEKVAMWAYGSHSCVCNCIFRT